MITPDDLEFLQAFEQCTLDRAAWNHRAHLRMAWLRLERASSFAEAVSEIRTGIQRYAGSLGAAAKYHETVTVAFAQLLAARCLLASPDTGFVELLEANPELLSRTEPVLHQFYTAALLASPEAQQAFVAPDRRPLPAFPSLREVTPQDAARVQAIYAPHVVETPVSFELVVPSVEEIRERIALHTQGAPWLIAEVEGEVAGYAYASKHREREAYRWSVDVSVYLDARFHRLGVGKVLYSRLLRQLAGLGYYNAFAGITLPNEGSRQLHESMGFKPIGIYRNVGFKLGRWHDVGWWQRELRPPTADPPLPRSR